MATAAQMFDRIETLGGELGRGMSFSYSSPQDTQGVVSANDWPTDYPIVIDTLWTALDATPPATFEALVPMLEAAAPPAP